MPKEIDPFAIVGDMTFEREGIGNNFDDKNIKKVQEQVNERSKR